MARLNLTLASSSKDTITLYRGEKPGQRFDDPRAGVWWTTDKTRAEGYAGAKGTVYSIEVPAKDLREARVGDKPASHTILRNRKNASEYIIPSQFQKSRKSVVK